MIVLIMLEDPNTPNIVSLDSNLKAVTLKGKPKASALGGFTNEILYKAGYDLLEIPSAEFSRGRGRSPLHEHAIR